MSGLVSKFFSSEFLIVFVLITLAAFFRLLHFTTAFNFSSDQAMFSITALDQWENKQLALIGPPFSFHIGDQVIYQGPAIYYLQTLFLLLGGWDPQLASIWFTIFSCLMIVPLYYGSKNLINQKAALILCLVYALNPFYILYTRFLWNPNFQFALIPLLIYLMGLYQIRPQIKWLIPIGIMLGILLQLHYQFFLGLIGILSFYIFVKQIGWKQIGLILVGIMMAFGPFIYYELTHKFYNLNNLIFFISHRGILYAQNKDQSTLQPHYYLSLSFLLLVMVISIIRKKVSTMLTLIVGGLLFLSSGYFFILPPHSAFGMAENWNYQDEVKVHQIIQEQQLVSFNTVNLEYDSLYHVQKYLLKKDHLWTSNNNYYDNQYLFAVSKKGDLFSYPAYEIQNFQPSKIIKTWDLNNFYKLYLLERLNN